jgi:hypothetical protein
VLLDPRRPSRDTFPFLGASLAFGEGVPSGSSRTVFAAKENSEIGVVSAHDGSSLLGLRSQFGVLESTEILTGLRWRWIIAYAPGGRIE